MRLLVDELAAELQGSGPLAAEAADSLSRLLLVRLARRLVGRGPSANPLTPQLHARLRSYVMAHLAERILVSDLGAVVGLSPHCFAHAFTKSAGLPPHQYVLGLRLKHAIDLLRHAPASLAEVATTCGFASQQHLTSVMRQRLGTTPARYRAANRLTCSPPGP